MQPRAGARGDFYQNASSGVDCSALLLRLAQCQSVRSHQAVNTVLVMNLRQIEGREASPSAGVIDSLPVKTTESGGMSSVDGSRVASIK